MGSWLKVTCLTPFFVSNYGVLVASRRRSWLEYGAGKGCFVVVGADTNVNTNHSRAFEEERKPEEKLMVPNDYPSRSGARAEGR